VLELKRCAFASPQSVICIMRDGLCLVSTSIEQFGCVFGVFRRFYFYERGLYSLA
jgi:hypothetical protein